MIYMVRALWLNCAGLRARVAAILFDSRLYGIVNINGIEFECK